MPDFEHATRVENSSATLHPDWEIWGPNGGYLSSIALRAVGSAAPEGHRPVTFSCQYLFSPPSGEVEIEVTAARIGRSAACFNVALIHARRTALQAQVWTTNRTSGPEHRDVQPSAVPPPATLKSIEEHLPAGTPIHDFWRHFDSRPVRFWAPGERDERGAVMETWYRHRNFEATDDAFLDYARALILIDTVPWPTFAHSQIPRPTYIAPSLDLTVWFHDVPGSADWLLVEGHAAQSRAGLIHGGARVWSEDGRLLASGGSQLLVVDRR